MDANQILRAGAPWLQVFVGTTSEAADLATALEHTKGGRVAARRLRGDKMKTSAALFDEMAAALQFPPYFGENWDALEECLADLEWLHADTVILVILDAGHVLNGDTAEARRTFWTIVEGVAHERGQASKGPPSRHARSFRVLLQCTAAEEQPLRASLPVLKSLPKE